MRSVINGVIQPEVLDPCDGFLGANGSSLLGVTVSDYWQWAYSGIAGNTDRGALAEYIVAKAVGAVAKTRNDWGPYDVVSPNGVTIEVKSSAYLQTWWQKRFSQPLFSIRKSLAWSPETNSFLGKSDRHADVYVFCLLAFQGDKSQLDPLNLGQWEFYVVPTSDIEQAFGERKTIGLSAVQQLSRSYSVSEIGVAVKLTVE